MLTFRRGRFDGTPGPITGARVGEAATPPLPRQGTPDPPPPQQPSLCCLRGPAQQFHFPGGRRETREKERMLRPRGPGWCPRLCLPLLGVSSSTAQIPGSPLPLLCPARDGGGGAHSDFHGSRPSQQHFGLKRDTERTRLIEAREKRRERERGKQKKIKETGEDRRKRIEKEIKGGIKPPESLLVFLRPFFLPYYSFFLFFFFKAFSVDLRGEGRECGALHPGP